MELKEGSAKWHTSRVGKEAPFFLQTSQWVVFYFFVKRTTLGYYMGHNKIRILCPTQGKTGWKVFQANSHYAMCHVSERSATLNSVAKKRFGFFFFFFLPESCHHAFWLFLVSFAMLKGKKEQIFFFSAFCWSCVVLHPPQIGSYLFPVTSNFQKEPVWSQKRGCRQCSHATWMEACYLCIFWNIFAPQLLPITKQPLQRPVPLPFLYSKCHVLTGIKANLSREWSSF